MQNVITGTRIAAQIRMRRDAFSGTFLIVEGSTDGKLYKNIIDAEKCEISVASNDDLEKIEDDEENCQDNEEDEQNLQRGAKHNVKQALEILEKENFTGVLAIVDADFSRLDGDLPNSPNLHLTDYHDLEIMLLNSPALDKVMRELGSKEKISNFGKDILTTLLEAGENIGYLRWTSLKFNFNLKFKKLSFSKFIDTKTLTIDISILIKVVKDHSKKQKLPDKDIKSKLETLKKYDSHDLLQVCCGHDLIRILSIALCKTWGTQNNNDVKPEKLEMNLRLAYEASYFQTTQLYKSIQEWEKNNQPYQVLLQAA
jgi:hypothetical protein